MSNTRGNDRMGSDGFGSLKRLQSAESSQGFVIRPLTSKTPHTASSTTHAYNGGGRQTGTHTSNSGTNGYCIIQKN